METPNIWDKEVNDEWGKYCPQEIRNTFTGQQLCWLKSFADKYADRQVKKLTIPVVSVSFLCDFVNEFTDTEMPMEAIQEQLDKVNER